MSSPMATIEQVDRAIIKKKCEDDHLFFTRYFFKKRQNINFRVNWHHQLIADALQRVMDGKCKNLVINVPPGSSKTEMAVINFIARGLAKNPQSRFLHISSGDELALLNSQTARDIVTSDEYQDLWPLEIATDAKGKKRWNVIVKGRKAGGVYAVALGGQVIGFRAGNMTEGFSGAVLIDDPLKADDAFSKPAVAEANRRLITTVKSRKAHPDVPIIVIMQRLCIEDCTGFIKGQNLPGDWEFLNIPVLITEKYIKENIEPRFPHIVKDIVVEPADAKGRFSYWPYKEHLGELLKSEKGEGTSTDGNKINRFVFAAQYMQDPTALGGNLIRGEWFKRVAMPPKIEYRLIFADTAQKTAERNDYSVFECWGRGEDKRIYLLDLIRGKWEAPDLKRHAIDFWNKHKAITMHGTLREMLIEDKSSGTGLIQEIKRADKIPIKPMMRGKLAQKDKLVRVMDVIGFIEAGYVCLIDGMSFNSDFVSECESFTADNTHAHDDQIDPMCDAITKMLSAKPQGFFSSNWSLSGQPTPPAPPVE